MKPYFLIFAAALSLAAFDAHADDPTANPAEGVGLAICSEWVEVNVYTVSAQDLALQPAMASWLEGYISGSNNPIGVAFSESGSSFFDPAKQGNGIDYQRAFLNGYCVAHPSDTIMTAVQDMISAAEANNGIIPTSAK
jgi:hypothetical protein